MSIKGIRQVAVMVNDLQDAVGLYDRVLGMKVCYSEDLSEYGLRNAVLPAGGGTFVELLQPTDPQSAGARFLQRRGEGMYLLIFETENHDALLAQLKEEGVRITQEVDRPGHRSAFIHPGSMNGVFMELIEASGGPNPWPAAGEDWLTTAWSPLTNQIRQVAVLVRDLDTAIPRWEEVFHPLKFTRRFPVSFTDLEIAVMPLGDKNTFIELAQPTSPGGSSARYLERHGEGLYLLIFQVEDCATAEAHLRECGVQITTPAQTPGYVAHGFTSVWIHPRAMKGVFTQLSQVLSKDNPWPPAGEDWYR